MIYSRLQGYLAPVSSLMLVDLWSSKYGIPWYVSVPALILIGTGVWLFIDKRRIGPEETKATADLNPDWVDLVKQVKEIRKCLTSR